MKKAIMIIFFILLLSSCSQGKPHHNKELEKEIISIMNEKVVGEINLNQTTDFIWDKAFIILPYTNNQAIKERIGSKDPNNMEIRDDINTIVFSKAGKPIQYVEIPRYIDLVVEDETKSITPEESVLKFEKTP